MSLIDGLSSHKRRVCEDAWRLSMCRFDCVVLATFIHGEWIKTLSYFRCSALKACRSENFIRKFYKVV